MRCPDCCGYGDDDVYEGRCRTCGGTGHTPGKDKSVDYSRLGGTPMPERKFLGVRKFWQHHHCIVIPYWEDTPVADWAKDVPLIKPIGRGIHGQALYPD